MPSIQSECRPVPMSMASVSAGIDKCGGRGKCSSSQSARLLIFGRRRSANRKTRGRWPGLTPTPASSCTVSRACTAAGWTPLTSPTRSGSPPGHTRHRRLRMRLEPWLGSDRASPPSPSRHPCGRGRTGVRRDACGRDFVTVILVPAVRAWRQSEGRQPTAAPVPSPGRWRRPSAQHPLATLAR
jgi:hypothetical protein